MFGTLQLMGRADLAARLQHFSFGKVMCMSSRLGNVQLLSNILDQSRTSALHPPPQGGHHTGGDGPHAASTPRCTDLLRLMAQYPDVTATAMRNLEPSTILTYLFRLAHQLSSCYDVLQVVGAEGGRDVTLARAALCEEARQVLENGMRCLG
ncbi:DALR anticodon binding domain-containing protein [Parachaetomium inaequale]|uniref:arginine--tRNA ligase n=1 Tax=Parachaetomium inaequale TaxID=2588326 RepID=A0AAN6PGB8_9PEZI|nr:DALR anticodon binding domain-containing protein [Parachaetomium inaequale]